MRTNGVATPLSKERFVQSAAAVAVASFTDHAKQCVVRDCRCYGRKHSLLRSGGPLSEYLGDATEDERAGRFRD